MLTQSQYRALKFMLKADGIVTVDDPEIAFQIRSLIATEFATVSVTAQGFQAVRQFERENADCSARSRIATGMSEAAIPSREAGDA